MDIKEYVENYRFEFDGGGSYAPSESEKALLEDAIAGFLSLMTDEEILGEQERRKAILA